MDEATRVVLWWAFGELETQEKAKRLATLFVDDLVQVMHQVHSAVRVSQHLKHIVMMICMQI